MIELKNVSKIYGENRNIIKALDDVDLQIEEGKIITIMGPSGSGKSTLLNIIGAMDTPSSGQVLVDELNIANLPERKLSEHRKKTIGFVFQNYYLIPTLDVLGNVLLPLVPYRTKSNYKERAMELLKIVGLDKRAKSKVIKLSGGESQRVAIARALINDPKIILADEPTGNLDSDAGKKIIKLLISLAEKGKTVIIVTHDSRIAKMVSEHPLGKNLWIKDGKLIDDPEYDITSW